MEQTIEILEGMIYSRGFPLLGNTMNKTEILKIENQNDTCTIKEIEIHVGTDKIYTMIKNVSLKETLLKLTTGEIFLIDMDWNIKNKR